MNEFLAEMYGTRESVGAPSDDSDVEKLAEAQILDEALRAEGVDIDQLPGETILKLAHQILGEDSELVKAASGEDEEGEGEGDEGEEPFEEKVAQADFLGRVMAHSYVNEMTGIDKEAKSAVWEATKGLGSAIKSSPGRLKELLKHKAKAKKIKMKGSYESGSYFKKGRGRRGQKAYIERDAPSRIGGALNVAREHPRTVGGALAATTGVGTGAAYGGKKLMEKNNSALDALAEKRAMDWAAEHGLLEDNDEAKLAAAVDRRAYEMLVENGVDVDAIESQ